MNNRKNEGLVYSTEAGRTCPNCSKAIAACSCIESLEAVDKNSIVKIRRETKGRKGKAVTVISDLPIPISELKTLAKELKTKTGSGGTVKNNTIEIQGEHITLLVKLLIDKGWQVKKIGG